MNKRLLYRNKIVRLYEDDIWGIFFRKQKKRDLFFRKIGYQLFLEIFRKNTRAVKPTTFAWKKKIYTCAQNCAKNTKKQQKYIIFLLKKKYNFCRNYQNNIQDLVIQSVVKPKLNFFLYVKKPNNGIATVLNWWESSVLNKKSHLFDTKFKFTQLKTISKAILGNTKRITLLKNCSTSSHFILLYKHYIKAWAPYRKSAAVLATKMYALGGLTNNVNVIALLKSTYVNYCVMPLYLNIYFQILKQIYFFIKSVLFLQVKQNPIITFFDLFTEESDEFTNITQPVEKKKLFEVFCTQISPLFVKITTNLDSEKFGINFFKFFNKKQILIEGVCTKKIYNLRKKYKVCLLQLLNYFNLFIKIQQQNLKLKYHGFLLNITDEANPFRLPGIALNLEIFLNKKFLSNVIYTLQYFRFFLYQRSAKNTISKDFGKKCIYPLYEKLYFGLNIFRRRNSFSVKQQQRIRRLRKIRDIRHIKTGYTLKTKQIFFFMPIILRYCLKDKISFTLNYYKSALKKNLLVLRVKKSDTKKKLVCIKIKKKDTKKKLIGITVKKNANKKELLFITLKLKKQAQKQACLLQRFLRLQKLIFYLNLNKIPEFFSLFFKFLFFKKFIFENMIRRHILKLINYINYKNKLKKPLVWLTQSTKKDAIITPNTPKRALVKLRLTAYKHPYYITKTVSPKKVFVPKPIKIWQNFNKKYEPKKRYNTAKNNNKPKPYNTAQRTNNNVHKNKKNSKPYKNNNVPQHNKPYKAKNNNKPYNSKTNNVPQHNKLNKVQNKNMNTAKNNNKSYNNKNNNNKVYNNAPRTINNNNNTQHKQGQNNKPYNKHNNVPQTNVHNNNKPYTKHKNATQNNKPYNKNNNKTSYNNNVPRNNAHSTQKQAQSQKAHYLQNSNKPTNMAKYAMLDNLQPQKAHYSQSSNRYNNRQINTDRSTNAHCSNKPNNTKSAPNVNKFSKKKKPYYPAKLPMSLFLAERAADRRKLLAFKNQRAKDLSELPPHKFEPKYGAVGSKLYNMNTLYGRPYNEKPYVLNSETSLCTSKTPGVAVTRNFKNDPKILNNINTSSLLQNNTQKAISTTKLKTGAITQARRNYTGSKIILLKNENLFSKKNPKVDARLKEKTNEVVSMSIKSKSIPKSEKKKKEVALKKVTKKKNFTAKVAANEKNWFKLHVKSRSKKLLKWRKARRVNMRTYLREYLSGRIRTTMRSMLNQKAKKKKKITNKPTFLWLKYYTYWRQLFTGKVLPKTANTVLTECQRSIKDWQTNSLKQFGKSILSSQKRLWYAEIYVKQLFLYLHARKLMTKLDVRVEYAYWCFTTKTDNLYYNFICFKNNISKGLKRKRHTFYKLFESRAIRITMKQRLNFTNLLPVIEKHIQYINIAYTNTNNHFDVLSFMQYILNTSSTKYILAKKLQKLPVHSTIRKYFIFHWGINKIVNKKIKKSNIKAHIVASKRLLNQIYIRTKYHINLVFAESKQSQKRAISVKFLQRERCYSFFCDFILYALGNKQLRYVLNSQTYYSRSLIKINPIRNINLFVLDVQKHNFLLQWSLLVKNFKLYINAQKKKKCVSVSDTNKMPLFFRLVKYLFFFKTKTWQNFFRFLAKRLNAFKFSLKAQAHILFFFKKIALNNNFSHSSFFSIEDRAKIRTKSTWGTKYLMCVSTCYKALLQAKPQRKRKFFSKKKKILFWRWRNKFSIKRYFKEFLKQQFRVFFKTLHIFKAKAGKFLRYLKYMSKFSKKEKLRFLLQHSFRYSLYTHYQGYHFSSKNILFFRAIYFPDTPRYLKLLHITTRNLNYWVQLLKKKNFLIRCRYTVLLNIYVVYLVKFKSFFKKISYLPRVSSNMVNLQASSFLFLQDAALPAYALNTKWNSLYFLNDFYLYKQYKVYFYLLYKLWYLNQISYTFIQYVKYFLYNTQQIKSLSNKQIPLYSKFIVKNIFFRRLFTSTQNANVLTLFKNMSHFSYFFKYWVLFLLKLFVDTLTYDAKLALTLRVKKLKRIQFLQKTNAYLFLRNLLNLYLIKWTVFKWKKFFYVNKNLINTLSYARRRVRRLLYTVRSFFYQKYNKIPDTDSIFNTKLSDIINASDIKKEKEVAAKKSNKIFQEYVNLYIQKKQKFNTKKNYKVFELKHFLVKDTMQFKKTEYLLSFFASNHIYKYFNKLRRRYVNSLLKKNTIHTKNKFTTTVKEYNSLFNLELLKKYSIFLFKKIAKIKKQIRFFSLRKRKTTLDRMFTLDLYPVVKYVKKKTSFNSFYKYRMLKVWKFRKFYGCLTNYELNSICLKAYKYRGDIIIQFIILLEARLDTILYRTGFVTSMFEARQLINHGNFLVNNVLIKKRSYVLKERDLLSFDDTRINMFTARLKGRLKTQGLLFWPPAYLEVNYKYVLITFLYELLKINQIPYNFKLTGKDLNSILYYYY